MNIYLLDSPVDNPLFEGLSLTEHAELLDTWPADWRANYLTWYPKSVATTWPTPEVVGNVRRFNDFPCVNLSRPAFSQRAVDLLRDILQPNGELLPLKHKIGTFYFYNCNHMTNSVDLTKSDTTKLKDGIVTSVEKLIFIDEMVEDLTIFKVRTQLLEVFCTQRFVDRVETAGLQGFVFTPIWPLPDGVTFFSEMNRMHKLSKKWKPKDSPALEIKGNTVVLRLYCERQKASKNELAAAEEVITYLDKSLYDENQQSPESYFGNVEGHDVVDHEIRVFISTPDCDRLVAHLKTTLRKLPWLGKYHVVKRRAEYVQIEAEEEYVRLD